MPFSRPQYLIPTLHPEASLEALEHILSYEQIQLIMRLDGATSVSALTKLLSRSLTDVMEDVKDLVLQGVLQLHQRVSKGGRLQRVFWPPPSEEWRALPGFLDDETGNPLDTEPEVYTISSMELPAYGQSPPETPAPPSEQPPTAEPQEGDIFKEATVVKPFNFADYLAYQASQEANRTTTSSAEISTDEEEKRQEK